MTPGRVRDVAIVGGGLAGLTAAAFLARGGASVRLLEKRPGPGGRARTLERDGFSFDLGSHAIYREGPAANAYRQLGLELTGGVPDPSEVRAFDDGELFPLPSGPLGLLRASGLGVVGRLDFASFFARLARANPDRHVGRPVEAWMRNRPTGSAARRLIRSLVRLTTYTGRLDQDAGAVLAQLQLAAGAGTLYPDGGWGTVVRRLRTRAEQAGAGFSCSARVRKVFRENDAWRVRVADGPDLEAEHVVLAPGSPDETVRLLADPPPSLREAARAARPVHVACLDLGLRRLPEPSRPVVLGSDRPLYVSDYASVADVAPDGAALLHAVHYEAAGEPERAEGEIEDFLDRVQPGWRDEVLVRQFLPHMTVHHDRPDPARGGLPGRYGPEVPEEGDLYVAGDWVGPTGLLADAAVASGRRAAREILAAGIGQHGPVPA